ncbi:hypothetical protein BH11PLA1_BH11PLA1_08980 [soil metagenome]
MKTIWTIISILAVANLIGLLGFAAWLKSTDRLDGARVERVRAMLATPIAEEAGLIAQAGQEAAERSKKVEDAARHIGPAQTAAEALAAQREREEVENAAVRRAREEMKQLQATLEKQRMELQNERAALDALRARLEAKEAEVSKVAGTRQFRAALATLQAQKAPAARQVLQALIGDGKREEAVGYLAAMEEGPRAKVMGEFIKSDERLASQLLEELRTRGIRGAGAGSASDGAAATGVAAAGADRRPDAAAPR